MEPPLIFKRATMEEQEKEVLLYSLHLSHSERLQLLNKLQKLSSPDIYKHPREYFRKCLSLFQRKDLTGFKWD
jgi:hypothetical protein